MAPRSLILSCLLAPFAIRALQVTPDSPCAAACQDSDSLDTSDPNSSNTKNSDITCQDDSYGSSKAGIKWKNCMTCLQNSTFTQGSENDQMWFLYNSRYAMAYCVFGFPNATDIDSSPCITSTACGPLQSSLEEGILTPHNSSQYGYCDVDGGAMTGPSYDSCLNCISATGETQYTSNYLVALVAGCRQKSAPGKIIGLNDTVFSSTVIGIVDPSDVVDSQKSETGGLPTTTIAIIVICIVVFLALAAALIYIRRRKRRNRRARAAAAEHFRQWGPQSPLSFQCQAQTASNFPTSFHDGGGPSANEMSYAYSPTETQGSIWKQNHPVSSFQNLSAVSEQGTGQDSKLESLQTNGGILSSHSRQSHHPSAALHSLDTSALPSAPAFTYHSPSSAVLRSSPSDSFTTPTSTTSTRSNTQLLPKNPTAGPYSPADLANPESAGASGPSSSPLAWRPIWPPSSSPAPPALPPKSPRTATMGAGGGGGGIVRKGKRGRRESGSPVESRRVDTVFPPPPTGR